MYPVGLSHLESLNLSFTVITDSGLRKLRGLSSLRSLNLDARQITDAGLAALTSKHFLRLLPSPWYANLCPHY